MSKFLRTSGVSDAIVRIISEARNEITIVCPYLNISNQLTERIQQAANRGVRIIFIYGKSKLSEEMDNRLGNIDGLEQYFYKDLHAKCYMNESIAIITSMNLYEYSEKFNREMGILIEKNIERDVYVEIRKEVKSILDASEKQFPKKQNYTLLKKYGRNHRMTNKGFCIRCGEEIFYNPNRPYCGDCFVVWKQYGNPDYQEYFCHRCGFEEDTSMHCPLCRTCYMDSNETS